MEARSPHRIVAVLVVACLLALAAVGNAAIRDRPPRVVTHPAPPDAAITLARQVSSSAWYCPGPLSIGAGAPGGQIVIANLGTRVLTGELVVSGTAGTIRTESVEVAPGASARYPLPDTGPIRQAAATVLVNGGGAGVEEVAFPSPHTAGRVPLVAPCSSRVSTSSYVAAGGSRDADNVNLALYDPGATPAVANVAFSTSNGPVSPPAFQGVTVGAGELVVLDVGRAIPGRAMIATTITAEGGQIVSGALLTAARGHGVETALIAATDAPASSWRFPPEPAGPGTAAAYAVYNPGSRPAAVTLTTTGTGGAATATATVPPGGVVPLATGAVTTAGALRSAELTVRHGSPVICASEVVLERALPAAMVRRRVAAVEIARVGGRARRRRVIKVAVVHGGPQAPTLLPALPAGYGVGVGVSAPARRWVLPVGIADTSTGELVTVANTSGRAATVRLRLLRSAGSPALHGPATLVLPPGGNVTLALSGLVAPAGDFSLVVDAAAPVVVGASLYAAGSPKAVGLATVIGLPILG